MEDNTAALFWGEQMDELFSASDVDDDLAKFDMQNMLLADDDISLTASGGLSEDETSG